MLPEFPETRPLLLEDHSEIAEALARGGPVTCDLSPANLFIWRDSEATSITRAGDSLCILVEPRSEAAYFLEPVGGSRRADSVRKCLTRVDRVSRASKKLVDTLSPVEFELRPLRDHYDYVYRTQVLAELKGKEFDGKRNHIRKFVRTCPDHEFRPLERSLFGSALNLFDMWAQRQGMTSAQAYCPAALDPGCQRRALERAFEAFELLGLTGGVMIVRGELQGFIVASTGLHGNAIVHFQYANTDVPGIYQTLLREACRRLFTSCTWVNLEEDLGLPGLRKTKLSYHPLRLEQKYEIRTPVAKRASGPAASQWHTALRESGSNLPSQL